MDYQIPKGMRLAIVSLPLSQSQQEYIFQMTGSKVTEAMVSGVVPADKVLVGEIVGIEAAQLAERIWQGNQTFINELESRPNVNRAFARHTGHEIERTVPNLALLR